MKVVNFIDNFFTQYFVCIRHITFFLFLVYIKTSENTDLTYYQRNKDLILSKKKKDYYKSNIERLREQARDNYKSLSEEKNKRQNTGRIGIIICLKKRNRN